MYAFGRDDQGRAGFSPGKVIDPLKSVTWSCLDFVQTNALVHVSSKELGCRPTSSAAC